MSDVRVADDDWPETQTNDGDSDCDPIVVAGEPRQATLDDAAE